MPNSIQPDLTEIEIAEDDAADISRQYIGFHLGEHEFAIPVSILQEIIRVPLISTVPLSPPVLRGLANLRGTVLPVLNLRQVFNMSAAVDTLTSRVIVVMLGKPVGFLVDRVNEIFSIEDNQLETNTADAALDNTLLAGLIRHNYGVAMSVNFEKILQREFSATTARNTATLQIQAEDSITHEADETRLVTFLADGQEYAFDIAQVEEIIFAPEKLMQIPNAHPSVAGIVSSQDKLLPVFYLRPMLSLAPQDLSSEQRIIVVALTIANTQLFVGLVVDSVTEVIQVARDMLDNVPAFLGRDSRNAEITAICRLDGGKRLVSVLSAEALFGAESLRTLIQSLKATVTPETDREETVAENQLVIFRLLDEEFALPIEAIQEIVRVLQLVPVPKTPDFIAGVINLRGTVLPVVDQRKRFGLAAATDTSGSRIMVLEIEGILTGFMVDSITEVLRVSADAFEATPDFFQPRITMVKQVAHLTEKRMVLMLDTAQLLDSVELKTLSKVATKKMKSK